MEGMPGERRGIWPELVRLYWASALAVGVVALALELALGEPALLALGTLYLGVTLVLARLQRALLATLVFPGLDPYPRAALFSVHALAAYLGVRIRGWLTELERVQDRLDWVTG